MKIYNLAHRISNFIWDFDPYDAKDKYGNIGELVSEIIINLSSKVYRKGVVKYLQSIIEEDWETKYAKQLIREVNAL